MGISPTRMVRAPAQTHDEEWKMSSATKKQRTSTKTAKGKKSTTPAKAAAAKAPAKGTRSKVRPVRPSAAVTAPVAAPAAQEPDPLAPEIEAPAKSTDCTADQGKPTGEKLSKLDVPTLQARYLEVVGRPTGSDNRSYLVWKIREAQMGRIPVGPRQSTRREGVVFRILPMRMEADLVEKLDEVWRRRGLRSRMHLFRESLQAYLSGVGETDVAAMLTAGA
jgi:hypothetical protein